MLTRKVELNLTTITAIKKGLEAVGIDWEYAEGISDNTNILYSWYMGEESDSGAALYIGIDESKNGTRLRTETSLIKDDYIHAHALAMLRNKAKCVSGPLTYQPGKLSWVTNDWLLPRAEAVLNDLPTVQFAEKFAIRLSIHLGDFGVPVNSKEKSAWGFKDTTQARIIDLLAYNTAEYLKQ